ncbi:MAG: iron ABC transporter permease, partial [Actinomycetota bacterium]|nr:iron ABC transporter permease [Actinomycetota bacterium]
MPGLSRALALGAAALLAVVLFVLTVAVGSVSIPVSEVVRLLLGQETGEQSWAVIVREVRLPRALTGLLAGAALGVSGLQMQTLFRNPLADPFILGISAGASLGVALVVLVAGAAGTAMVGGLGLLGNLG